MAPMNETEQAVVRWLRAEEMRHPRSDYAAWCSYFRSAIERGEHKETEV